MFPDGTRMRPPAKNFHGAFANCLAVSAWAIMIGCIGHWCPLVLDGNCCWCQHFPHGTCFSNFRKLVADLASKTGFVNGACEEDSVGYAIVIWGRICGVCHCYLGLRLPLELRLQTPSDVCTGKSDLTANVKKGPAYDSGALLRSFCISCVFVCCVGLVADPPCAASMQNSHLSGPGSISCAMWGVHGRGKVIIQLTKRLQIGYVCIHAA